MTTREKLLVRVLLVIARLLADKDEATAKDIRDLATQVYIAKEPTA